MQGSKCLWLLNKGEAKNFTVYKINNDESAVGSYSLINAIYWLSRAWGPGGSNID